MTITRKLGEFKELGYIELVGSRVIIIKDLEALESYVL
ncbi:MAG: helix-turn-helix domain-containing protein [Limnochordia bacterium]